MLYKATVALALTAGVNAQKVGTLKTENHPPLSFSECTTANGCTALDKEVTVDSNWRWTHQTGEPVNCYTGNEWDTKLCPDVETCKSNCALEGADEEYTDTYGITTEDDALTLGFVTKGPYSTNVGSRTYLMDDEESYYMFKLKNKEFTFDVDVSNLPCGLNGALYFVQMDKDGGKSKYENNEAGAKYGTGYCDAQCPHDLKWINGEPNMLDWKPSPTDPNAGHGKMGTCCVEMDIWEANKISTAYTAHSCDVKEQMRCEDAKSCGDNPDHRFDGVCDKNGCDFQTFRLGNTSFFGPGASFTLDSTKKMTVVTQFITEDGTDTGKLTEIRRFYKQGSLTIPTPTLPVGGQGSYNSLSDDMCEAWKDTTKDGTNFLEKGGFGSMDDAMDKGMVLVMSIWDDHDANMLWLDSTYPTDGKQPGSARGTCDITSGVPKDVEKAHADATVQFSNIRFGAIGSTTSGSAPPSPGPSPPSPTPSGCPGGSLSGCINLCPSSPDTAYKSCVQTCVSRCASEVEDSFVRGAKKDGSCKPWGQCTVEGCCPTGWECTAHPDKRKVFNQCTPKTALTAAFMKTKPDAKAIEAFMTKGATHFAASGLPK